MRALTIMIALISLVFIRCKSNGSSNDFSGTYVLQTRSEYAKDYDTLIVTLDHSSANTYSIHNNSGFQKIRDGVTLPKEFKETSWLATWNEDKKVLAETELGRKIQFKENGKLLLLKNSTYQKIK